MERSDLIVEPAGWSEVDDDTSFRAAARAALEQAARDVGWSGGRALGSGDGHDRDRRRVLVPSSPGGVGPASPGRPPTVAAASR